MVLFFKILSFVGIFIGIALLMWGIAGNNLAAPVVVMLGIFVAIKETMDIIFAG